MNYFTKSDSNVFNRVLTIAAIAGPMLLVFAAGSMPEGVERGDLVVYGFGAGLAVLAVAVVVRAAYARGFRKALETLQRQSRFERVAA